MSFQWVINNAAQIGVNTKRITAITQTRDGTVRTVSRGSQPWIFEVRLPDGPRWSEYRQDIAKAEALGSVTADSIGFDHTGHEWMFAYQGDMTGTMTGTWTEGAFSITVSGGTGTGFRFRAGDFIQLGSGGRVYQVTADVASGSTTVPLHRPVIETTGSGTVFRGESCIFEVICVQFPNWNLFARDQVGWDGPFIFVENLV